MNEDILEELNKIEVFCESLQAQTELNTPVRAAYQSVIDQCVMLSASLGQREHLNRTLVGKIMVMELEYRANVLIGVWAKFTAK